MNKVSWTNKDDLIRATTVVLTTVVLMTVFLFMVDTLWTFVLRMIGVLQFGGRRRIRVDGLNTAMTARAIPRPPGPGWLAAISICQGILHACRDVISL